MKTVEVVAAVIVRNGRVFATQRGYGDWKDWWEFPGGKIESGETPPQALVREIHEERSNTKPPGGWKPQNCVLYAGFRPMNCLLIR